MRYIIQAQLETEYTDENGTVWGGSYGLPTFEVHASSVENARTIANEIIGYRVDVVRNNFEPIPVS